VDVTTPSLSLTHKLAPFHRSDKPPYPALILLHGRGSNEDDLLGLTPYLDPRLFTISVRAPFPFPFGGFTWYDLQEVGAPDETGFSESYDRIVSFLDGAKKEYPIDPNRIFLLGFSMGSVMCFALSLTRPEEIRGVIAHSGYIPEQSSLSLRMKNLEKTGFFVAHGTVDPVIPIKFGRRANELLSQSNAQFVYKEYPIGHQVSEESLRDLTDWLHASLDHSLQHD
jgi:phospholipase/carboxylesterase